MSSTMLLNRYKEDSIITAPREKLLLMLYDGALRNLNIACKCLDNNNRAGFGHHISKGQAIIAELLNSLDHDVGGEITRNLEKLYLYIIDRLIEANLSTGKQGLDDSAEILNTLKDGWDDAIQQTSGEGGLRP
jgi:flagellar protein FliS